ncbi:hypothetical protein CH333_06030 [candidate division WOR-3 bacterium JGI_Cruoil_03_44_89]|uniref:GTP-binding protein n=1 Tax=candidate division WOR-3 bacterium JGI_Cruoil_03_44_89 TaxID=1973748 RepID=A0A235BSN4_UNCW3|nr:MAG: hypothetical protein CH333_06030 [candidate division WOR-3 bacterium JGI_Cruoil_03_44_89]
MGNRPAKLFCGLIGHSFDAVIEELIERFGKIDQRMGSISFIYTDYYIDEMGENLLRDWVTFEKLIDEEDIGKIKNITCGIERKLSLRDRRTVNIDPGYVNLSRVILASTKDYSHRIYISQGIFAEVTLIYKHKNFTPLPWTYPDYRDNIKFFERVRKKLYTNVNIKMQKGHRLE